MKSFRTSLLIISICLIAISCEFQMLAGVLGETAILSSSNSTLFPGLAKKKSILANLEEDQNSSAAETYNDPNKSIATEVGTSNVSNAMELIGDSFGSTISNAMKKKYLSGYENKLPVFGENLFVSPINLPLIPLHNPEYTINIGDKIVISIWGEYELSKQFTVDSQGNIFLPKVGPVHVAGFQNKDLNQIIDSAIKSVYTARLNIYAAIITAQPIKVFVSGYVLIPGLYAGISSNSVLYFLSKAGGVILNQGSFRDISVVRNGKVIQKIDLYEFLLNGNLPYIQLQQRDSIVVGPSIGSIDVSGKVYRPASYEPSDNGMPLKKLLSLSGVKSEATSVLIQDNKGESPQQLYIDIEDVNDHIIYSGEDVTLISDQDREVVRLVISGAALSPHQLVLPTGTTMEDVMEKFIKFKPRADASSTQLYRKKLALQQKAAIEANLLQFERDAYTTAPLTSEGALIQTQFAKLVTQFVSKIRQVEPKGQLVINSKNDWKKIILENEDVLHVPFKTQIVRVDGCVLSPTAMLLQKDYDLSDYIKACGGFTNIADTAQIIVISLNGSINNTSLAWYNFWSHVPDLKPGDQVMVLPGSTTQALTVISSLAQVIYQVAVGARVVMPGGF